MVLEEHKHDGLVFRKSKLGNGDTIWEVYWNNWISIGSYKKDESFAEIVSQWPDTKKSITQDLLDYD